MGDRLAGKVALVTGAASGIGAACVERFTAEGARVAGLDIASKPDGSKAESWWNADVADEDAVRAAVSSAVAEHGGLDIVVNAAGVLSIGNAQELDTAEWDRVIGINLKGTWLVSKHAVGHLVARGNGSIVNLASIEGLEGFAGQTAYNVSKGGVVLLTRNMAADFGPRGVRVNCLCPGLIDTPLPRSSRTRRSRRSARPSSTGTSSVAPASQRRSRRRRCSSPPKTPRSCTAPPSSSTAG